MGFFSSAKSKTVQGLGALPKNSRNAIADINYGVLNFISPFRAKTGEVNQANIDRFTPLAQTADETRAYEMMRAGFTPDQNQLNSDIAMQENPFNHYVIDEINRQAGGEYSILKQAMTEAGQIGSNRQQLGANDIDLSRLNQIGGFQQSQFNQALQNALTLLPTLRQNDATNLAGIGTAQRSLDWNTKQAPVNAILAAAGIANQTGIGTAQGASQTTTNSGGGGFGSVLGAGLAAASMFGGGGALTFGGSGLNGIGQAIGSLGSSSSYGPYQSPFQSDRALKENIEPMGQENGHNIYRFTYKGDPSQRFIGVMAQEVQEKDPEAVVIKDGFLAVDYNKIGVRFRGA